MKLDKRRRIENKTDYGKRVKLLKGNAPRLVVRKTNRYLILEIIDSKRAQDKVTYFVSSKELLKFGWPKNKEGSLKSLPAAYLSGVLLGKKAKGLDSKIILDIGLSPNTKGSKLYSVVKGIADSGIKIDFDNKVIPSKERLEGENSKIDIKEFNKVKESIK